MQKLLKEPSLREDGMSYHGIVTAATDTTHFTIESLRGFKDAYFNNWYAYVVRDAAGGGAAPQTEQQQISGYVSSTGVFTHSTFTVQLAVGDVILLLHEDIAITQVILSNVLAIINERLVTSENNPSLVAEDETFRFAVTVIDNDTGPIATANTTPGTYDLHRIRSGAETTISSGNAFSKITGMVYTDISFATADWDPDDSYIVIPNFDTTVSMGGNTYYVPMTGWSGLVHNLTNIEGKIDAIQTDVGNASTGTLNSIYGILGNPSQTFLAMVGYEGAASLASKITAARAGYLDQLDFALNERLGTPAGASLAADLLVINNFVDNIETIVENLQGGEYQGHKDLPTGAETIIKEITTTKRIEILSIWLMNADVATDFKLRLYRDWDGIYEKYDEYNWRAGTFETMCIHGDTTNRNWKITAYHNLGVNTMVLYAIIYRKMEL